LWRSAGAVSVWKAKVTFALTMHGWKTPQNAGFGRFDLRPGQEEQGGAEDHAGRCLPRRSDAGRQKSAKEVGGDSEAFAKQAEAVPEGIVTLE